MFWVLLQARPEATLPGGYGAALVQTLLALGGVCVLAWVVLRWASRRGLGVGRGQRIKVVERVPLDARRALFLVEVGGKMLLVATGDGAPTLLTELDPADVPTPEKPASFADVLKRIRKPLDGTEDHKGSTDPEDEDSEVDDVSKAS